MIRTQHPRPARPGFTLVELMVAAAICVIIMTILAVCFQTGIDAMREMRSAGDMTDQLRSAGEVMKRDFVTDHFLAVENVPNVLNQGTRLSDYQFQSGANSSSVRGGFYQIVSPASTPEGTDGDGFISYLANTHSVWMTCVLPGDTEEHLYSAVSPAGSGNPPLRSPAAEVAYFLGGPGGAGTSTGSANGTPLYNLYRRQRLVALTDSQRQNYPTNDQEVISTNQPPMGAPTVNTMADVAGGKRPGTAIGTQPAPVPLGGARFGDDILLSNVISFEVKPTWVGTPGPTAFMTSGVITNSDYPYDNLTAFPKTTPAFSFDTTASPSIRVVGIQIRVRVYDPKLQGARQATYVFDQ